jgi:FdhD protein
VAAQQILSWPLQMRRRQELFDLTGGVHAAALFDATGELLVVREDVGRHNAVDKVLGFFWQRPRPPHPGAGRDEAGCAESGGGGGEDTRREARAGKLQGPVALCVSGRISFEIVQKAVTTQVALIAAVSAPSSLAIALAQETGITLVGFVREGRFVVYTHPERIN